MVYTLKQEMHRQFCCSDTVPPICAHHVFEDDLKPMYDYFYLKIYTNIYVNIKESHFTRFPLPSAQTQIQTAKTIPPHTVAITTQ